MPNSFTPFFLPLLFALMITSHHHDGTPKRIVVVKCDPDLTFFSNLCGAEHDVGSIRKDQARRLTNDAVEYASPLISQACGGTWEEPAMYYRATCSTSTSPADCAACVAYAADQLVNQNVCDDQYNITIDT